MLSQAPHYRFSEPWELKKRDIVRASLYSPMKSWVCFQLSQNFTRVQMLGYSLHSHLNMGYDGDICLVAWRRGDPWDLIVDPSGVIGSQETETSFFPSLGFGSSCAQTEAALHPARGPFDGSVVSILYSGAPMLPGTLPAYSFHQVP